MKLKKILFEISSYKFSKTEEKENPKFNSFDVKYKFNSPENEYTVHFMGFRKDVTEKYKISVDFWVPGVNFDEMTGEGKVLKIMNTIMDITENFHEKYHEKVDHYVIQAAPTSRRGKKKDSSQKARIYKYFIERRFPTAQIKHRNTQLKVYLD